MRWFKTLVLNFSLTKDKETNVTSVQTASSATLNIKLHQHYDLISFCKV